MEPLLLWIAGGVETANACAPPGGHSFDYTYASRGGPENDEVASIRSKALAAAVLENVTYFRPGAVQSGPPPAR